MSTKDFLQYSNLPKDADGMVLPQYRQLAAELRKRINSPAPQQARTEIVMTEREVNFEEIVSLAIDLQLV